MSALQDAAAFLAQQWPCFPCRADKRPATARGFYDATRDPGEVRRLFATTDADLIGVPTGRVSDLAVIDCDTRDGGAGLEWFAANRHRIPPTRIHRTRSGGLHVLFRYPAKSDVRNSINRVALGVDVRAEGGYIIVPPSPGYTIEDDAMPAEMPAWLIEAALPQVREPQPRPERRDWIDDSSHGSRYGLAALQDECEAIMNADFGAQETTLNSAAFSVGQLVAGGEVAEGFAKESLYRAALAMMNEPGKRAWSPHELRQKVERGMADGARSPRQAPPRAAALRQYDQRRYDAGRHGLPETGAHLKDAPPAEGEGEATEAPAPDLLPLLFFDEIQKVTDCKDFVQGVLVEQSAAVVYGDSNAGKTFWTTDLALHVAAGKEWNGRRVEQGGVVYCVLEGGSGFKNRVYAWRSEHGLEDSQIPFAAIPSGMNLLDPEADTPRLIATIKAAVARMEMPVKLVVIDTLARAFAGGNENASEDMNALVRNMDRIRAETGACVLFVHHSGKDQARGARGHSSLRAAIDTEIEVKADEEAGTRSATVVKQRELKKGDVFGFGLRVIEIGENRHGEPVTTCVVEPAEASGDMGDGRRKSPRLSDDQRVALEILHDLCAEQGRTGFPGVPQGISSVPEQWWRERYYDRAKPGAERKTREKAFRRTADALQARHLIAAANGRVWPV